MIDMKTEKTLNINGIDFEVIFNHTPEKMPTYNDYDGGDPGVSESVEILSINESEDLVNIFEAFEMLEQFEDAAIKSMH